MFHRLLGRIEEGDRRLLLFRMLRERHDIAKALRPERQRALLPATATADSVTPLQCSL